MILLDTNIVSDVMRSGPTGIAMQWMVGHEPSRLFLSTVTLAELRYGIALVPEGRRKRALAESMARMRSGFGDRVVQFDEAAADLYGAIVAERRGQGRPIQPLDAQIAAIAASRRAALATRNTPDFDGCGLALINPWDSRKDDA